MALPELIAGGAALGRGAAVAYKVGRAGVSAVKNSKKLREAAKKAAEVAKKAAETAKAKGTPAAKEAAKHAAAQAAANEAAAEAEAIRLAELEASKQAMIEAAAAEQTNIQTTLGDELAGINQILMPTIQSAEIWKKSNR